MHVLPQLRRIIRVALFLTLLSIFLIPAAAALGQRLNQAQDEQIIHVWKVGSPHRGEVPDSYVPASLQQKAARIGYHLEVRAMPAKELSRLMSDALAANEEPDVLVIDNYGLLLGINTPLGHFDGLNRDPRIRGTLVNVSEAFKPLETVPGWQFLLRSSRNFAAAKSLAMMEPNCNPEYGAKGPWAGDVQSQIENIGNTVATAYFHHDLAMLDSLVGDRYLNDSELLREPNSEITKNKICGGWGNSRLAFVNTITGFENPNRLGWANLLEIFDRTENGWRLLSLGADPRIIKMLQQRSAALKTNPEAGTSLHAPMLIAPDDGAQFNRWPVTARPNLEWNAAGNGSILYLVEGQFTNPIRPGQTEILWNGRGFTLVPAANNIEGQTITTKATFGAGQQPHRWRIWAIDENGFYVRSEWRIVNYVN